MKILHINKHLRGGAAKACLRLHQGLMNIGVDSKVLTLEGNTEQPSAVYNYTDFYKNGILKKAKQLTARLAAKRRKARLLTHERTPEGFYFTNAAFDITAHPLYQEADIIHLHWVNDFLDYRSFFQKNKKPIVWTAHDMTPFTGGYPYEKNFPKDDFKKLIEQQITLKKNLYNGQNMTLITPSKWMKSTAEASELAEYFSIQHVPNSLDTATFKYDGKHEARTQLRLPESSKIVLFVADSVNVKRKGMAYLQEAMRTLYLNNLLFIVVGRFWQAPPQMPPYRYFGAVQDEHQMNLIYSAADVFVMPSIEDNFPNTVLESLCCGTPVVGFDTGGIPEQIIHGENGAICPKINAYDLKKNILEVLSNDNFLRQSISQNAQKKYALSVQAQRMISIYKALL